MRLLDVKTFQLEEFFEPRVPPYAILSHTWGREEILFQDVISQPRGAIRPWFSSSRQGAVKVRRSCAIAAKRGHKFIWVDTCCINKESSTELSEAINSMFRWYAEANVCFVYLADYTAPKEASAVYWDGQIGLQDLGRSRWFHRGWTLQELVAPRTVIFYDKNWFNMGGRSFLSPRLHQVTNIAIDILRDKMAPRWDLESRKTDIYKLLKSYSIHEKLTWAAGRETTREEDVAYCLLGMFDINMPLLYGEGKRAFERLQKKIIKQNGDQSILVFDRYAPGADIPLFAPSPDCFQYCRAGLRITTDSADGNQFMRILPDGLETTLLLCRVTHERCSAWEPELYLGILNCLVNVEGAWVARPALVLKRYADEFALHEYSGSIYLVRPDDDSYATPRPEIDIPGVEWPRLPINLHVAQERRIKILHSRSPDLVSLESAGTHQTRLCPFQGAEASSYIYGDCFPKRAGTMLASLNCEQSDLVVLSNHVAFFICIRNIDDLDCSCSLVIVCFLHNTPGDAVEAASDPDGLFATAMAIRERVSWNIGRDLTHGTVPIQCHHLATNSTRSQISTILNNGHSAHVEIRVTNFLRKPLFEVHVTMTGSVLLSKSTAAKSSPPTALEIRAVSHGLL